MNTVDAIFKAGEVIATQRRCHEKMIAGIQRNQF
jgi:hypothetical protein